MAEAEPTPTEKGGIPNILILKSDEHNPFISSVEGDPVVQTPNMQRLARMGTYYENCYCLSPLCTPSRSAYLSGMYVHQIKTYNNCCIFKDDYPTYGEVLKEQGIHTVMVGKTDAYRDANELGFSELFIGTWPAVRNPGDLNISRSPLKVRPMERPDGSLRHEGYGVVEETSSRDRASIEFAINWLKTKALSLNKPWTLEINTSKPHFPNEATQDLWDLYSGHESLPKYDKDCRTARHPYAEDLREHFQTEKYPESSIKGLRRGYYAVITYLDRKLGELLDVLEETGQIKNTIIIYTSDHGEMHGKFGLWWKSAPFDDSARVPLIIAGPGFKKNHRVKTPVNQLDLQACIFETLKCSRPAHWAGSPLQNIPDNDPQRCTFSEYHGHGVRGSWYIIRRRDWKYIWYKSAPNQLFNMRQDPQELSNVIDKYPQKAAELEKELRKICDPDKEHKRSEAYIKMELAAIEAAGKAGKLKIRPGGHAWAAEDIDDFINRKFKRHKSPDLNNWKK
ncbi:sulfatase-like hydrolase/transferase [Limihaloglobus sulfuriphilus]|nr:sulfatase-like hydrolase/transferase [Limihaloglobus sulfuriphilus]